MVEVKVMIESVPIKEFTKKELDFYFKYKTTRSICHKISSYLINKASLEGKN
jgi:hypothetical protein